MPILLRVGVDDEMAGWRSDELYAALEFLEELSSASDLDAFAETLIQGLDRIIPAELVAYNEVNPVSRRAVIVGNPDINAMLPGANQILEQHMDDNPLVGYTARTRDGRAVKWSDFISQRQLHSTALWSELFRPFSIERQMVTILPAPDPLLIGIVLNRSGRDFSERERDLLNMLRPHLVAAYRSAEARTLLAAHQGACETRQEGVILLGPLGEPLSVSPRSEELVSVFGEGAFPEQLRRWVGRAQGQATEDVLPLLAKRGNLAVEARFLTPAVVTLRAVGSRLESDGLRTLGLSPREREVLTLVAEGLTNAEIAGAMVIEPPTVKKHLENIYRKLGVKTRTAAAALAFQAGNGSKSR